MWTLAPASPSVGACSLARPGRRAAASGPDGPPCRYSSAAPAAASKARLPPTKRKRRRLVAGRGACAAAWGGVVGGLGLSIHGELPEHAAQGSAHDGELAIRIGRAWNLRGTGRAPGSPGSGQRGAGRSQRVVRDVIPEWVRVVAGSCNARAGQRQRRCTEQPGQGCPPQSAQCAPQATPAAPPQQSPSRSSGTARSSVSAPACAVTHAQSCCPLPPMVAQDHCAGSNSKRHTMTIRRMVTGV